MSYINELLEVLRAQKKDRLLKIGFLGLGKTNLAILNELNSSGNFRFTFRDTRDNAHVPRAISKDRVFLGKRALEAINEDVLFVSPSVNRASPEITRATERGVLVTSDCEEFFKSTRVPVFSVTGSDGKSTVTTLASAILTASGIDAPAIGNIGTPYICAPLASAYVAELSSFNLEYLKPKSYAAVITNITPNHLNFHGTFYNYKRAKLNLLEYTERTILSYDDLECRKILQGRRAYAVFSTKENAEEIRRQVNTEHVFTLEGANLLADGKSMIHACELFRTEDYNIKNMLAAIALTYERQDDRATREVLRSFRGLRHRCEHILSYGGVDFYNSSIDTSPTRCSSTLIALQRRVRLILGGRGKGLDFGVLKNALLKYADTIALYGEEGLELENWLSGDCELAKIPRAYFRGFDAAVDYITSRLQRGDAVLLSPAATAYGEFLSFEERGERFCELIYDKFGAKPQKT